MMDFTGLACQGFTLNHMCGQSKQGKHGKTRSFAKLTQNLTHSTNFDRIISKKATIHNTFQGFMGVILSESPHCLNLKGPDDG